MRQSVRGERMTRSSSSGVAPLLDAVPLHLGDLSEDGHDQLRFSLCDWSEP